MNARNARFGPTFAAFTLLWPIWQLRSFRSRCCAIVVSLKKLEVRHPHYPAPELDVEVARHQKILWETVYASGAKKQRFAPSENRQEYQPQW